MAGITYPIPALNKKTGKIVRPIVTMDSNGNTQYDSWQELVGSHNVNLVPKLKRSILANGQFKVVSTHEIYADKTIPDTVKHLDSYMVNGRTYRITEIDEYGFLKRFRVLEGDDGVYKPTQVNRKSWTVTGLAPGNYTFGSDALSSVSPASTPHVYTVLESDGGYALASLTSTGFVIDDQGFGGTPSVTAHIVESIGGTECGYWKIAGVAPGVHTFGSGAFTDVPVFSQNPFITCVNEDGVDSSVSVTTGTRSFTINDLGFGDTPTVTVHIFEHLPNLGRYVVTGLSPSEYNFNSGNFSDVGPFTRRPIVLFQDTNSGKANLANVTKSGFTIQGQGFGETPLIDILVIKQ